MRALPDPPADWVVPAQRFDAVAAASMGLLALLFGAYAVVDRQSALTAGQVSAARIAEQTALTAQTTIDLSRQLLQSMAMLVDPPVRGGPTDMAHVRDGLLALSAQNPHIQDLAVIAADGRIASWTGVGPGPDIRDREYWRVHLRTGDSGLHVGSPLLSKVHPGRWFFALSAAVRDPDGRLRYVLAAIVDVAVLRERSQLSLAIPGSTQAIVSTDGTIYAQIPARPHEVGRRFPVSPDAFAPAPATIVTTKLDQHERIVAARPVEGYPVMAIGTVAVERLLEDWTRRTWLLAVLWLVLGAGIAWLARRANAVSALQRALASTDALTGVSNRGAILASASRHWRRSVEHAGSLSLLMVDIDRFKSINDRFGHLVGDDVLRRVSQVLHASVRSGDIVGRYGGEEFLVLMPDTGLDGALLAAEKLRAAVAERVRQPEPVTVSIGVATAVNEDSTLDSTLSRADAALYRAKAGGRDRVCAG